MKNKQSQLHSPVMIWLSLVVRMTLFAFALMWPAGTWYWREAWVMVGLWTVFHSYFVGFYLQRFEVL